MKRIISAALAAVMCLAPFAAFAGSFQQEIKSYPWAREAVQYCFDGGIMTGDDKGDMNLGDNITRAQMAKIFSEAFDLSPISNYEFRDVPRDSWYYRYSRNMMGGRLLKSAYNTIGWYFHGEQYVTREEFAAVLVRCSHDNEASENCAVINYSFKDADEVDEDYKYYVETAVKNLYVLGDDNAELRPKALLTRAEACCILYRALEPDADKTPITGESEVTVEQAISWATKCGGSELFIQAAPLYWYWGNVFGLRADVMYAQAGKETAYGNYGGAVLPEMNNWAGIKKRGHNDDATEDHESFATPEDGVRAHFNHMSAYVGLEPVGEVHERYYSIKSMDWAGSVKYVEQLGGKWCPDINYGYQVLEMVKNMKTY